MSRLSTWPTMLNETKEIWEMQRQMYSDVETLVQIAESAIRREHDRVSQIAAGSKTLTHVLRSLGHNSVQYSLQPHFRAGVLVTIYGATEHALRQIKGIVSDRGKSREKLAVQSKMAKPRGDLLKLFFAVERAIGVNSSRKARLELDFLRVIRNSLVHSRGQVNTKDRRRIALIKRKLFKLRSREEKFGLINTVRVLRSSDGYILYPDERMLEMARYATQLPIEELLRQVDRYLRVEGSAA